MRLIENTKATKKKKKLCKEEKQSEKRIDLMWRFASKHRRRRDVFLQQKQIVCFSHLNVARLPDTMQQKK